jgi:hypothetical protein
VSLAVETTRNRTEAKASLIKLLMLRYNDIIQRGGEPPLPITSITEASEPGLIPNPRSPRAPSRSGKTLHDELEASAAVTSSKPRMDRGGGGRGGMEDGVNEDGRPNPTLQFAGPSGTAAARSDGAGASGAAGGSQEVGGNSNSRGRRIAREISEQFKFDLLISGGPWHLCELLPTAPPELAAMPGAFEGSAALFWNEKSQLYYDSSAPPSELAAEVKARTLGHDSAEEVEKVLSMLGGTGFPKVHAQTFSMLKRYASQLLQSDEGDVDRATPVDFREKLWTQSSRSHSAATATATTATAATDSIFPSQSNDISRGTAVPTPTGTTMGQQEDLPRSPVPALVLEEPDDQLPPPQQQQQQQQQWQEQQRPTTSGGRGRSPSPQPRPDRPASPVASLSLELSHRGLVPAASQRQQQQRQQQRQQQQQQQQQQRQQQQQQQQQRRLPFLVS